MTETNNKSNSRTPKIKAKSIEEIELAEREIKEKSIPYEYQTKQIPLNVVKQYYTIPNDNPNEQGEDDLIIIPPYQRALVWSIEKQSKFIESLFLGVSIPPIFVAQTDEDGKLEVIDGSQRIRTVVRFLNNKFKLKDLTKLKALNDFYFQNFDPSRQNKFSLIDLRFHVLTDKANSIIRADIFKRINTTSEPLTDSQVRKGEFANSKYYSFVLKIANSDRFKQEFYTGVKDNKGEHEELVLRYFVYSDVYLEHRHDVGAFLSKYIENKEDFTETEEKVKEIDFIKMLDFVEKYFPYKFNKTETGKAIPRVRFESISVGVHLALKQNPDLVPNYMKWLESDEFDENTTSDASNNEGKLKTRIEFVRDCLLNVKKEDELGFIKLKKT